MKDNLRDILEYKLPAGQIDAIFEAVHEQFPSITMQTESFHDSSIPDHALTYNLLDPNPNAMVRVQLPDGNTVFYRSETATEFKEYDVHKFDLKHFGCGKWQIIAGISDIDERLVICIKAAV